MACNYALSLCCRRQHTLDKNAVTQDGSAAYENEVASLSLAVLIRLSGHKGQAANSLPSQECCEPKRILWTIHSSLEDHKHAMLKCTA